MKKARQQERKLEEEYEEISNQALDSAKRIKPSSIENFTERAYNYWNTIKRIMAGTSTTYDDTEIPILIISTHGSIREMRSFISPINYLTIHAVPYGVCNYVSGDGDLQGIATNIYNVKDNIYTMLGEQGENFTMIKLAEKIGESLFEWDKKFGSRNFEGVRDTKYDINDDDDKEIYLQKLTSHKDYLDSEDKSFTVSGVLQNEPALDKYFVTDSRVKGTRLPTNQTRFKDDMITFLTRGKFINILDEIEKEDQIKQPGEDKILNYEDDDENPDYEERIGISLSDIIDYIMRNKHRYLGDNDEFIIVDLTCNSTFRELQTDTERRRHNPIIRGKELYTPNEKGELEKVRGIAGQDDTPYLDRKIKANLFKGGLKKSLKNRKRNKYSRKKNIKKSSRKIKLNKRKYTMKKRGGAEKSRTIVKMEQIDPVYLKIMLRTNIKGKANIGPFKIRQVMKNYTGENNIFFLRQLDFDNENWDLDIDELRESFTTPEKLVNAVDIYLIDKDFEKNYTKSQKDNIIQDNIAFLLRTYFPKDSIFYLDGKPHTIFGSQWDGHWTIKKRDMSPYSQVEDKYDRYEVNVYLHLVPGESIPLYDSMKAYCQFRSKRIQDNIAEGSRLKKPDIYIQKDTVRDSYDQVKGTKDRLIDSLVNEELKKRLKEKYGK